MLEFSVSPQIIGVVIGSIVLTTIVCAMIFTRRDSAQAPSKQGVKTLEAIGLIILEMVVPIIAIGFTCTTIYAAIMGNPIPSDISLALGVILQKIFEILGMKYGKKNDKPEFVPALLEGDNGNGNT